MAKTSPTPTLHAAARQAGLIYADETKPGLSRKRSGKSFTYTDARGCRLAKGAEHDRVRKLAIPPAWTDVWISASAKAHIQATGRDAKGRKQYKYHADFRAHRESSKFAHMLDFAKELPKIRKRVRADMRKRDLCRDKVLASVIALLEATLIRVGNESYAKDNQSYGLTTLHGKHVKVSGNRLSFRFKGKSGKNWDIALSDRRLAKIVRSCQDLPGQDLFGYVDDNGDVKDVTSSDINAYLKEISHDEITAKDFRTWAGTVLAAVEFQSAEDFESETAAKRNVTQAVTRVAAQLGNTVAICRKCYIHPEIIACYMEKDEALATVKTATKDNANGLRAEERAVLNLLKKRLSRRKPAKEQKAA